MKIFNVSLHRSATKSVHAFCKGVGGLKSLHWLGTEWESEYKDLSREQVAEKFINSKSDFDVCSDIPVPSIYDILDNEYPDSKFLLILRDPGDWIKSIKKHIGTRSLNPLEALQYSFLCDKNISSLCQLSDKELRNVYGLHTHKIKKYFSDTPGKLAVVNLKSESFSEDVKNFLEIESNEKIPNIDTHLATGRPWRLGQL
jgi:hypothetical protein